jgi:hypothetical protein
MAPGRGESAEPSLQSVAPEVLSVPSRTGPVVAQVGWCDR